LRRLEIKGVREEFMARTLNSNIRKCFGICEKESRQYTQTKQTITQKIGAIAGMVTIKPRGRKTKGEFLKTCEWKGTNAQQINNPI
jgi:uncharacterized membrane protein YebE (DUF533 family)